MKAGKFVPKIIVLLLMFFLSTTGAAQALNISKCKGECCQNIPEKSHHKDSAHRLSDHHSIEFEPLILLCGPIQQFRALASKTPKQENCHNGSVPPCCRIAQSNDKVEGLISTALSRADRLLETGTVCILPETHTINDTFGTASARYSIPASATPPPLYLKNSAFLC